MHAAPRRALDPLPANRPSTAEELVGLLELTKRWDDWPLEIGRAPRDALVTLVLVSSNAERAYCAREEIANAIQLARENPSTHRVVPLFLDDASRKNPPYGLAVKHGLQLPSTDFGSIAAALQELIRSTLVRKET